MKTKLREKEIRFLLHAWLQEHGGGAVIDELKIDGGRFRADVCQVGESLVGIEIKSDFDTFGRLSTQVHAYNRVFDESYLCVGEKYAEYAENCVPQHWGIIVACTSDAGVPYLHLVRRAQKNYSQNAFSLASLLPREAAVDYLSKLNVVVPRRLSLRSLWITIGENSSPLPVRNYVIKSMLHGACVQEEAQNSVERKPFSLEQVSLC